MTRKLTITDVIHYYLAHYCDSRSLCNEGIVTMWSEMNEIKDYYRECSLNRGYYSMDKIVRMCVRGLYTTGHQKRVKENAIDEAVDRLMNRKFKDYRQNKEFPLISRKRIYNKFIDFEELYDAVKQIIGDVNGIDYVTVYDTARRLGNLLKNPIYPVAYVYLHYNKVNRAAESILNRKLKYREPSISFVCEFGTFPSICIEDILCVFSDVFVTNVKEKNDSDGTVEKFKKILWRNKPLDVFLMNEDKKLRNRAKINRWPEFQDI